MQLNIYIYKCACLHAIIFFCLRKFKIQIIDVFIFFSCFISNLLLYFRRHLDIKNQFFLRYSYSLLNMTQFASRMRGFFENGGFDN